MRSLPAHAHRPHTFTHRAHNDAIFERKSSPSPSQEGIRARDRALTPACAMGLHGEQRACVPVSPEWRMLLPGSARKQGVKPLPHEPLPLARPSRLVLRRVLPRPRHGPEEGP
jgi:hypothetical protein